MSLEHDLLKLTAVILLEFILATVGVSFLASSIKEAFSKQKDGGTVALAFFFAILFLGLLFLVVYLHQ